MTFTLSKLLFPFALILLTINSVICGEYTTSEAWQYSIYSGIGVGLIGFIGAYIVVLLKKCGFIQFESILKIMVAFAAGALIGDALVHMIPESFSSEGHAEDEGIEAIEEHQGHSDSHSANTDSIMAEEQVPNPSILSLMIIVGFVGFFVIEKVLAFSGIAHNHGVTEDKDHHSHGESSLDQCHNKNNLQSSQPITKDCESPEQQINQDVLCLQIHQELGVQELNNNNMKIEDKKVENNIVVKESISQNGDQQQDSTERKQQEENVNQIQNSQKPGQEKLTQVVDADAKKKVDAQGILILAGDFLHNILDGIALGVVFISGTKSSAIATVVAIIAHEIPQEIGDASVLIQSNFSIRSVLICSTLVNFSGIIGVFIGLGIGGMNEYAGKMLSCIIAGNFIYLGAVDMMPLLTKESTIKYSIYQFFGLCFGFGIMFLLLLTEAE